MRLSQSKHLVGPTSISILTLILNVILLLTVISISILISHLILLLLLLSALYCRYQWDKWLYHWKLKCVGWGDKGTLEQYWRQHWYLSWIPTWYLSWYFAWTPAWYFPWYLTWIPTWYLAWIPTWYLAWISTWYLPCWMWRMSHQYQYCEHSNWTYLFHQEHKLQIPVNPIHWWQWNGLAWRNFAIENLKCQIYVGARCRQNFCDHLEELGLVIPDKLVLQTHWHSDNM